MSIELQIIKLLESELGYKLPENGVIAGQSVAEAYFRLNNIPIKTRIKDVDLFSTRLKGLENYYNKEDHNKKSFIIVANSRISFIRDDSSFGMVNLIKTNKLVINNVYEKDRLNIVIIEKVDNSHKLDVELVVDSFDINSVQIGIDLTTQKLYKTEDFDSFIVNKQLKIINYCSPVPSIARLMDKFKTSEGTYLNLEHEINLAIAKLLFYRGEDVAYHRGAYMSEERFESFPTDVKETIKEYFEVKLKKCREKYYRNSPNEYEYFKIFEFKAKESKLENRIIENINNIIENSTIRQESYPFISRTFLENLFKKGFSNKVSERILMKNILDFLQVYHFNNNIFKATVNDVNAVTRHLNFSLSMFKNFKIKEIANFIRKMEKNDTTYIIGMYETGEIDDPFLISKNVDKIIEDAEKRDLEEALLYEHSLNESLLENKLYEIEQIKTPRKLKILGTEMKHCVGGYWESVKCGDSYIFDIYKKKEKRSKNNRWTLEIKRVYYDKKNKYKVNQVRGVFNSQAPYEIEEISKKLSKDMNDYFKE